MVMRPLNPLCGTLLLQFGVNLWKVQPMQIGLLGLGCLTFNGGLSGNGHTTQAWKGNSVDQGDALVLTLP